MDASSEALQTREETDTTTKAGESHPRRERADEPGLGTIGRFQLKEALGGGGFGIVYRAFDPTLGRMVALKVPKFASDDSLKSQRFLTEAHAAASLHHPNIVAVFESGQAGDKLYIVSEYVEGEPLSRRIGRKPPGFQEAARWLGALADALAYAHQEGIVHRDIKPDNIMMAANDRPLIMDFGLAKLTHEDSRVTGDGSILGTPAYMSPEQARGETDSVGPHSDQYSLGVVLYELLTGRRPFEGPPHKVIAQVADDDPPEPRSLNADIPKDLAAICQKSMEKDPARRFGSLHDMAEDLARWMSGRETLARPISWFERGRRWCRRNPVVAALSLAVAGLIAAVAVIASIGFVVKTREVEVLKTEYVTTQERETEMTELAERRLAEQHLDKGSALADGGKVPAGLLWFARSLETLPSPDDPFDRVARTNIDSHVRRLWPLRLMCPHGGPVKSVAFSPDGTRFASLGLDDQRVLVWNAATGDLLGEPIRHDRGAEVLLVQFSADGRKLYSAGRDQTVRIHDFASGVTTRVDVAVGADAQSMACSDDLSLLVVARSPSRTVQVFDTQTGRAVTRSIELEKDEYEGAPVVALSHNGRLFAAASRVRPLVRLWNVQTGEQAGPDLVPSHGARTIAFSPDDRRIALSLDNRTIASSVSDGRMQLIEIESGRVVSTFPDSENGVVRIAFSRDGRRLASAAWDGSVRVWDTESGAPAGSELRDSGHVAAVEFSPDGRWLIAGGSSGTVRKYELTPDDSGPRLITHDEPIYCFSVSRKTGRIALAGRGRTVYVWDGNTGQKLASGTRPDAGEPYHITFSADGRLIASSLRSEGLVFFWDGTSGKPIGEPLRVNGPIGGEHVVAANLSPDGSELAIGGDAGRIVIWNTETRGPVGEPFDAGSRMWNYLVYSDDGRYLVAALENGSAPVWDLTTRTRLGPDIQHQGPVLWCGITANAESIFTASADYTVRQWNPRTGRPSGPTLQLKSNPQAGFSSDGKLIATNDTERNVRLWDAPTGKPMGRTFDLPGFTRDMMFGPDSRWFVAGCSDNIGRVWNTPTPVAGTPEQIRIWLEVIIGLELTPEGTTRFLDVEEWQQRRDRLKSLGGEPIELGQPR